jgi:SAM-dependent methyltransferase
MALYEQIGAGYATTRRPDPRLAAQIRRALGPDVRRVVNVGAGSGSYEPTDLDRGAVVAVEPSETMLRQRAKEAAPAVRGVAEALPFPTGAFDAALAVLTVHHWTDVAAGLAELRRVARHRVVVFTWDLARSDRYWMIDEYVPASRRLDRTLPSPEELRDLLGGGRIEVVPVPADCTDGFYAAWWRRPEAYLDPAVRAGISGLARLDDDEVRPGLERLAADLEDGSWHRRHADLLEQDTFDGGYRLVIAPA